MKKIDIKKIKERARKWLKIIADRSFAASLFLILIALLFGANLYYKYNYLLNKQEPTIQEPLLKLQEKVHKDILDQWENMQDRFEKADFKNFINPFVP